MAGVINIVRSEFTDSIVSISGNEDPAFPLTNLLDPQPRTYWRTSDLTAQFECNGSATWDTVGFLYLNATVNATWRVRAAATQGELTSNPVDDSGNISVWPNSESFIDWPYAHAVYRTGRISENWLPRLDSN